MKEMKISFGVSIVLERTDVHLAEEELLKIREEVFLGVFKRVMREIEEEVLGRARVCKKCGLVLVRNGRELKRIKTLIGVVEVNRVRLRCQGCQEDVYPLDEAIGLGCGEQMTLGVRERALWAAVEVSYEKAHQFLEKFTRLEVSRHKIHGMALEEGGRIEFWEEERRRQVFEQGQDLEGIGKKAPEVLYIQVDGTRVNDRARREWMECKVGASFSQRVLVSKDRVCLIDKKSYASIEGVEAFGEKFFLECVRQGVLGAKELFFIGDGARVKTVEERKKIIEAMTYVRNNLDWIENIPKVKGYGSGPVEKTVDITVARRFKKRGMSWYKRNANPLF